MQKPKVQPNSFNKFRTRIKKFLNKAVPFWLVCLVILYSSFFTAITQYYFLKKNFNEEIVRLAKTTKNPEELVELLKQEVLPQGGYMLTVRWNDIGRQLLNSGVIDLQKYKQLFANEKTNRDMMRYLSSSSNDHMLVTESNSHFMVNTLWALGFVNKNNILDFGPMKTYGKADPMTYASTGGWNLGQKPTQELYSSKELVKLSLRQQELVKKIAQNVFRICCNNSTEFPDCNHGMAALGYIEIAVSQGVSEKQIYKDLLALNSFWFPRQYVELAAYFREQKTDWKHVDPKTVLSKDYSSSSGYQKIRQSIQSLPGITGGGGCST